MVTMADESLCMRCRKGKKSDGAFHYARIEVGYDGQIYRYICGNEKSVSERAMHDKFYGHPAVLSDGCQDAIIQWRGCDSFPSKLGGEELKEPSLYKLCSECHQDFLQLLGVFLRLHSNMSRSLHIGRRDILTGESYMK